MFNTSKVEYINHLLSINLLVALPVKESGSFHVAVFQQPARYFLVIYRLGVILGPLAGRHIRNVGSYIPLFPSILARFPVFLIHFAGTYTSPDSFMLTTLLAMALIAPATCLTSAYCL